MRAIIMIILSLLYFEWRYLCRKQGRKGNEGSRSLHMGKRLLLWLPSLAMIAFSVCLLCQEHFAPRNTTVLFTYLAIEGFIVAPLFAYVCCSFLGFIVKRLFRLRMNYGNLLGLIAVPCLWAVVAYGVTTGFTTLRVRHLTYASDKLPGEFNGYRIVQFSDLHIGSYTKSRHAFLQSVVDSINAQHADMIVFTGDLINLHPDELYPHLHTLLRLKAHDGVISVLGNHDYADYLDLDEVEKTAINSEIVRLERSMGWTVLADENMKIERGSAAIQLIGTENIYHGSNERCISRGDIAKAMAGADSTAFTIMLQHTPKSWRTDILPSCNADLTLSGDTHGMQFSLFGWCPMSLVQDEWGGFFTEDSRAINVSTGIGGFVPFRFGMDPEIVVITLARKHNV